MTKIYDVLVFEWCRSWAEDTGEENRGHKALKLLKSRWLFYDTHTPRMLQFRQSELWALTHKQTNTFLYNCVWKQIPVTLFDRCICSHSWGWSFYSLRDCEPVGRELRREAAVPSNCNTEHKQFVMLLCFDQSFKNKAPNSNSAGDDKQKSTCSGQNSFSQHFYFISPKLVRSAIFCLIKLNEQH